MRIRNPVVPGRSYGVSRGWSWGRGSSSSHLFVFPVAGAKGFPEEGPGVEEAPAPFYLFFP